MMNMRIIFGGSILLVFVGLGAVLPWFSGDDPTIWQSVPRNRAPSADFILGTTSLGQDVFWVLTWSVRNSLWLGLLVAALSTMIGVLVGLFSGLVGGTIDRALAFLMDAIIIIPVLPVLVLVAAIFLGQTSLWVIALLLVAFNWPFPGRQVRSVALSLRERGFVLTAWMSGESRLRIILYQFFPYLRAWSFANFINTVLVATMLETSIAVIGLSNNETATLGTMLYWAIKYQAILAERWWWVGAPVIAIILLFIGLFLFSTGIEQRSSAIRGRQMQ